MSLHRRDTPRSLPDLTLTLEINWAPMRRKGTRAIFVALEYVDADVDAAVAVVYDGRQNRERNIAGAGADLRS